MKSAAGPLENFQRKELSSTGKRNLSQRNYFRKLAEKARQA